MAQNLLASNLPEPRFATVEDNPLIERLWLALLKEGTTIYLPTDRNMKLFMHARDNIISEMSPGAVVVIDNIAVHMSGAVDLAFDTLIAEHIFGLGTYIEPTYRGLGLYEKLINKAAERVRDLGYNKMFAEIKSTNIGATKTFLRAGGKRLSSSYELELD